MLRKKQVTENIQERSRKKVKFKKKVSLAVIVMMLVVSVAGCGKKKETAETTKATKNEEVTTTAEQTTGELTEGEFDFSQVFDNIEINGKKVPFPFTLNDLGEGYELGYIVEMGDGTCSASLKYKDEKIALIYILAEKKEDVNKEAKIVQFSIFDTDNEAISINGINCKSDLEMVEKSFNGLTKAVNESGQIIKTSDADENENRNFAVYYNENLSIMSIEVRDR